MPFTPEQKVEIYTWMKIIQEADPQAFSNWRDMPSLMAHMYPGERWMWDWMPELWDQFPRDEKSWPEIFSLAIERVIRENTNGNTNLTK